MGEKTLPFLVHLEELRRRIIYCVIAVILTSTIAYFYKETLLLALIKPVEKIYFLTLTEAFLAYLKISIVAGAVAASPFIAYHVWAFTWSAFRPIEKRYIAAYGITSFFLFLGGAAFGYAVGLPTACHFLLSFSRDYLVPVISVNKYINFCLAIILIFGALFEFPLLIAFITNAGVVTIKQVEAKRKYIIVGIFVIAAVLTPPDVFTQLLAAVPLYLLFEISVLFTKILRTLKRKKRA